MSSIYNWLYSDWDGSFYFWTYNNRYINMLEESW